MEFARSKDGIFLNQQRCALDFLYQTRILGCNVGETPIYPNLKLHPAEEKDVKKRMQNQRLVGRLIYLSHAQPDIAFAFSVDVWYVYFCTHPGHSILKLPIGF